MKTIKTAVAGLGFIGPAHVEALRRIPGIEVIAISDVSLQLAEKKAEECPHFLIACYRRRPSISKAGPVPQLAIEKKCHERQQQPGNRIVNRQIPISEDELDAVAKVNPAIEPVIERQGHSEIECHPQRNRQPPLGP